MTSPAPTDSFTITPDQLAAFHRQGALVTHLSAMTFTVHPGGARDLLDVTFATADREVSLSELVSREEAKALILTLQLGLAALDAGDVS